MRTVLIATAWLACGTTALSQQWQQVGQGVSDGGIRDMFYDSLSQRVYCLGHFVFAGDQLANGTAYWDGSDWHSLGLGMEDAFGSGVVRGMRITGDSILVSGFFPGAVGVPDTRNTALWDGTAWRSIGPGGTHGIAWGQLANEDGITLAGAFISIAGSTSNRMARYTNGTWNELCTYPTDQGFVGYTCIAKYQGQYIFGGNINAPGLREVGWLDGDTLRQLGPGIRGDSWVNDMAIYNGKLMVAGEFYAGGNNAASGLMAWDGEQFSDPLPGIEFITQVSKVVVYNGELFASGRCIVPGTPGYYGLVRFDGENICLYARNVNCLFPAIASTGTELFAAPNMPTLGLGGDTVNSIVRYDLSAPPDTCITIATGQIVLNKPYSTWSLQVNATMGTFELSNIAGSPIGASVEIHDLLGRSLGKQPMPALQVDERFTGNLPPCAYGAYLMTIRSNSSNSVQTIRFAVIE